MINEIQLITFKTYLNIQFKQISQTNIFKLFKFEII